MNLSSLSASERIILIILIAMSVGGTPNAPSTEEGPE